MKKHVAILTGGTSSERDVALWSSETVKHSLEENFNVHVFDVPFDLDRFLQKRDEIDVVVPVFHGPMGEDGVIQGFLRTIDKPFIFSDVEAHAVGMNKHLAKMVAKEVGLNVATGHCVVEGDEATFVSACMVKPLAGGSTIGVSVAKYQVEMNQALATAFQYADVVMIEDFIEGREFTVGVIEEDKQPIALPVSEIISTNGFFDYEQKYTDGKMAQEICPADIGDDLAGLLQDHAVRIHNAIGARHLSRTDFIVDKRGTPWFLEINTIPGMTKNSLIPKALRATGRSLDHILGIWIEDVLM